MTIFELGAIGEFIGAIAVVATLVYLAVQIKQNTQATRAQIHQARSDQAQEYFFQLAGSRDILELFTKLDTDGNLDPSKLDQLDPVEMRQLRVLMAAAIGRLQNAYYQKGSGFLEEEMYESMVHTMLMRQADMWEVLGVINGVPVSFQNELRQRMEAI
jgi:hypothetical protein